MFIPIVLVGVKIARPSHVFASPVCVLAAFDGLKCRMQSITWLLKWMTSLYSNLYINKWVDMGVTILILLRSIWFFCFVGTVWDSPYSLSTVIRINKIIRFGNVFQFQQKKAQFFKEEDLLDFYKKYNYLVSKPQWPNTELYSKDVGPIDS
jgi:hypothetical protein